MTNKLFITVGLRYYLLVMMTCFHRFDKTTRPDFFSWAKIHGLDSMLCLSSRVEFGLQQL